MFSSYSAYRSPYGWHPRRGGRSAPTTTPERPAPTCLSALCGASPGLEKLFLTCLLIYLTIYALEAPIRYLLNLIGKDSLILARDTLIIGPLVLLPMTRALKLSFPPVLMVIGALLAFHAIILIGNVGSLSGAVFGVKILINLVFGFLLAGLLIAPGRKAFSVLLVLWFITVLGAVLDKSGVAFPWIGMKATVGNLSVDVSKDWEIQDALLRRVAGFTRSSICIAVMLPALTIVLLGRVRDWFARFGLLAVALVCVFLTTQKGALIALVPVGLILLMPGSMRLNWLRASCIFFMILAVGLPLVTPGLHMNHGEGVFSTESIFLRIAYTWPEAWTWILHHQLLLFGVGLGGIGGPQRLYAPNQFNPADNLFVLLYAYFGIFAVVYLLWVAGLVLRRIDGNRERAETAIAILAFMLGYGTVLSMLEDQSAPIFIGAAMGVLLLETRGTARAVAPARPRTASFASWRSPYVPGRSPLHSK